MKIGTLVSLWSMLIWAYAQNAFAFYHPSQGRWLSRDPIEEKGGKNLYRALLNNAANNIDMVGMCTIELWCWPAFGGTFGDNNSRLRNMTRSGKQPARRFLVAFS
jgi:uncharacterized protein RhaS with RHS repeats